MVTSNPNSHLFKPRTLFFNQWFECQKKINLPNSYAITANTAKQMMLGLDLTIQNYSECLFFILFGWKTIKIKFRLRLTQNSCFYSSGVQNLGWVTHSFGKKKLFTESWKLLLRNVGIVQNDTFYLILKVKI